MNKLIFILMFVSSIGFANTNLAFNSEKGSVRFLAVGKPSALKIKGKGLAPQGQLQLIGTKVNGTLELDLTSLKTGISLRDNHMKEKYLEVAKYPKSILTITDMEIPEPLISKKEIKLTALPFKGKLKLKDVEHEIIGIFDIQKRAEAATIEAKFDIKLTDYNVAVPSYSGITVADDVKIDVTSNLAIQTPQ